MKNAKNFYLVSLGCAKNTVDSESMAALLEDAGYRGVDQPSKASILIVNTCGFLKPAIQESLETLQGLAHRKRPGQLLIATGCLTERYRDRVAQEVPGVDGILGTRRWMDIVDVIHTLRAEKPPAVLYHLPDAPTVGKDERGVLRAAIQGGSSYLKIADGCRRPCAFCAIPAIKGTAVSRPPEVILDEVRILQDMGLQEIILIAQDTSDYGHDLGLRDGLSDLLLRITQSAPRIPWLRILYTYPGYVTDRLIEVMASQPQVLHYLDMPLQHAHPDTLRRMRRPANMEWVHSTLAKIRTAMPDAALRTTFIVGYPGETEAEFQALLDFVKEVHFDHIGAFPFFMEAGTASEPLGDTVPEEVKQDRLQRLMTLQEGISLARNQALVGRTLDMLIEGAQDGISIGRTYRDAPEIDGLVFATGEAPVGQILPVRITGALTHDLTAEFISTSRPR
ncbi:30S ribosomal protein S12 methylthiotransferase RimO [Levilinea saccharolytica]|uniref:Ribosomal protein uS12 methylthiotransferase RimO n=1 Tax=Levilinea saccharolytica TaxID=229921 RepID=A0A0P6XQT3_9CHLR|nr:30S ribosomal protein S12 methylthiotransferase RimO [Levilinea saccharolytica]KPL81796.1 hypothetical protein ADN01_09395 [Levilinea saccharolytica]GAP17911.1 SSU ribosomal protein S12P methylthiotransferase [Levilinea saccharolytica]